MVTDMIYWFLQLKQFLFCFYAGTREHVVDIINTFILLKPLLLTVLEVAKMNKNFPNHKLEAIKNTKPYY